MYYVSAQGIDERMINVHYYYYSLVQLDPVLSLLHSLSLFLTGWSSSSLTKHEICLCLSVCLSVSLSLKEKLELLVSMLCLDVPCKTVSTEMIRCSYRYTYIHTLLCLYSYVVILIIHIHKDQR